MSKNLSKYISFLDYFDKSLTSGGVPIASFATVIVAPKGITSASLSLSFSLCTGLVKKLLKPTRNKKKKHNKIVMLPKSKLNSIESKISEAMISNHRTIKMKRIDVKHNTYIDFDTEVNDNDLKFKVGDHVRASKHINIFAKG